MGPSASKSHRDKIEEGTPSRLTVLESPQQNARSVANDRDEERNEMLQNTKNTALKGSDVRMEEPQRRAERNTTPERLSAIQRLGPIAKPSSSSRERIPAKLRLGENSSSPPSNPRISAALRLGESSKSPTNSTRKPAAQRLGKMQPGEPANNAEEAAKVQRKPGRPPGKTKNTSKPVSVKGRRRQKKESYIFKTF
ncbi:hypothetical protein Bca4012_024014 [Brassica carinata]|uniref:Uncharacterized protein n=1 Tax=Brassica carinata TaxID=52824 RepID=A0A8X7NTI8_BRACI|nr:hypothetical protein Bca52824_090120 [Brassica carinata]